MKIGEIYEILGLDLRADLTKFDDANCEIKSQKCKNLDTNFEICAINSLQNAKTNELSYCDGEKNAKFISQTKASVVLVRSEMAYLVPEGSLAIICDNPHLNFAILSAHFAKPLIREKRPNFIAKSAQIMENVHVGSNSQIGENCTIMSGVYIGDDVKIGAGTIIHPNAVIYNDTQIGENCVILAGAILGSDGFGYAHRADGTHVKIHHNGNVILEDFVEIGANTTIDRGVFDPTIIKKGTKIDNLVQIGHNCDIGQNTLLVSQVGLAGSSILGRNVVMGGQSGTKGHIKIGDFAQIAARGGVSKDLEGGKAYAGYPIMELGAWFKLQAKIALFFKKN